jgi:hypothetical protein
MPRIFSDSDAGVHVYTSTVLRDTINVVTTLAHLRVAT